MYIRNRYSKSQISSVELVEGETIEHKIERIVANKEPIKDGAPEIFTERKDGVIAAYNIRTDRWEIAAEAMDVAVKSQEAKREMKVVGKEPEEKTKNEVVVKEEKINVVEPTQGKEGAK